MEIPDFETNSKSIGTMTSKHHVQGILFYYPHTDGRETSPQFHITDDQGVDQNNNTNKNFSMNIFWAEH